MGIAQDPTYFLSERHPRLDQASQSTTPSPRGRGSDTDRIADRRAQDKPFATDFTGPDPSAVAAGAGANSFAPTDLFEHMLLEGQRQR